MNPSAESLLPGFPAILAKQPRSFQRSQSVFGDFSRRLSANPTGFFLFGASLIAAHLLIVIFQPASADGYVYICNALASGVEAAILVLYYRADSRQQALRWGLLALAFSAHFVTYLRASFCEFTGVNFLVAQVILQVLCGSCFVFALTLPSEEQPVKERVLDLIVVLAFCVIRFLFLRMVVPLGSPHSLERVTIESGVTLLLACYALMAAPVSDRMFFRLAVFAIASEFVGYIFCNEIGYQFLHQQKNSPWDLADTVERVGCAVFFFYALTREQTKSEPKPRFASFGSVVPFTMTAFVVFLSATLLSVHPFIGYTGIAFGIGAFLLRVGFMSRHRKPEIVIEEHLVREIASEIIKDPLYGLADRFGLEPALAYARSSVNSLSPLSLILFAIEESGPGIEIVADDAESRNLVSIARMLNHWHTPDSTICYLGRGRFAMLMPATPLRIAMSLAEQVCLSVDALDLTDEDGPMAILAGVAACTDPSRVSGLLHTSSAALERAHVHREARVRTTPFRGQAVFDA